MNFFGVGPAEAGLVFVIGLLVVGPQRFPEIMRQAGRWYRVARAYSNEVMKDVRAAVDDIEREVKAETEELNFAREFTDLKDELDVKSDLKEAQTSVEEIGRETQESAGAKPAIIRPSARKADGETKPSSPPAAYYKNRDPATYDPFKAKEARDREAASTPTNPQNAAVDDSSRGSGSSNGSNTP